MTKNFFAQEPGKHEFYPIQPPKFLFSLCWHFGNLDVFKKEEIKLQYQNMKIYCDSILKNNNDGIKPTGMCGSVIVTSSPLPT